MSRHQDSRGGDVADPRGGVCAPVPRCTGKERVLGDGWGEFPLEVVQKSSPLVKLQDAAWATAETRPRPAGASPRRDGWSRGWNTAPPAPGTGTGLEPKAGRGTGLHSAGPGAGTRLEPRTRMGPNPHPAAPGTGTGLEHHPAGSRHPRRGDLPRRPARPGRGDEENGANGAAAASGVPAQVAAGTGLGGEVGVPPETGGVA